MESLTNNVIEVLIIGVCFYFFDLLWRGSKAYQRLTSKRSINNIGTKFLMIIVSIALVILSLNIARMTTGLFASYTFKIIVQGICLIIIYIMTSFIFMDKFIKTKKTSNAE